MPRLKITDVLPKITEESSTSLPAQLSVSTTPCCPIFPCQEKAYISWTWAQHGSAMANRAQAAGSESHLQLVLKMLCIFLLVVHHLHKKTTYGLTTGPKRRGHRTCGTELLIPTAPANPHGE